MLIALLVTAFATGPPRQSAIAQPLAKADEVRKLEDELGRLQDQIHKVQARLRKAREVEVAFKVRSSRSLDDPSFQGIRELLAMKNRNWGQCVVTGPDLVIQVNQKTKTIFLRGQPEENESFQHLVLAFDALYALQDAPGSR
jgi:hypothetical protein